MNGCDLVAVKGDELIIVEMKTHPEAEPAVKRQRVTESVYVAVPLKAASGPLPGDSASCCAGRLGLITVDPAKDGGLVEVHFHPHPLTASSLRANSG